MPVYLNTQDIARQLDVNVETVRRWLRTRQLKGTAFGRAGYRVAEADFEDFLRRRHETQGAAQAQVKEHIVRDALEDALVRSEARFARLFAANSLGMVVLDVNGRIHEANDAFLYLLGYSRAEIPGASVLWSDLTPADFRVAEAQVVQRIILQGKAELWEKDYLRKDGSRFSALVSGAVLDAEKGLAVVIVVDLSRQSPPEIEQAALVEAEHARIEAEQRQVQLQAALQREQETRAQAEAVSRQLAGVLATLPVAVLIVDKQGRTLQRNQAFEAVWGQDAPMLEQGIKQFYMYKGWSSASGRPLAAEDWAMARALQHGETSLEEEIAIETLSGERKTILHSAVPLRDETGMLVGGVATMLDITERKRLETTLREREEQLTIALEAAHMGAWSLNLATGEMDCTPRCKANFGLPAEAHLSYSALEASIHADDREQMRVAVDTAQAEHGSYEATYRVLWPDGSVHWIVAYGREIATPKDAPRRMVGTSQDITEQRRVEREAMERARELEAVFEAITDGVFILGAPKQRPQVNRAARELLGLADDQQEVPQQQDIVFDLLDKQGRTLPQELWPEMRLRRGESLQGEQTAEVDMRLLDGRIRSLSVTGAPLRQTDGVIVGGVLVCRDVTERRQLEQRTRQALEALLIMAEEMVHLPVSDVDTAPPHPASAVVQRLVELICRVLGCKRASITSIDPISQAAQSVAVSGLSQEQAEDWQNREPGFVLSEYFSDPVLAAEFQENGVLVLDLRQPPWNTRLMPYGAQTLLLVSMQVGTRRVGILTLDYGAAAHIYSEREQTLARAVAELAALVLERERLLRERAEALAQEETLREANRRMDEFIGLASHELRTPLTTIKAALQLAARRLTSLTLLLDQSEKVLAHLSGIQSILLRAEQQADRQRRLMNDLLDVSRIQVGTLEFRMRDCNVVPIVRDVVESQQQTTPQRSIHLEAVLEEASVHADADRISQVVSNYLSNALKYSPTDAPITISIEKRGSAVWIAVRDKGSGLSPEAQKHIWERFYRVPGAEVQSGSSGGLGLGLYICRMIVEAHHGQQGVESVEGVGSTFWFTLPLLAAAEVAS